MKRIGMIMALLMTLGWTAGAIADSDDNVARAQFTTGIEDREPVDEFMRLDTSEDRVYFFTELRDLEGRTITHRWMHDGEIQGEVDFEVGGPRWRVWSSKDLLSDWTGGWTVEVVDDEGERLGRWTFIYSD